LRTLLDRHLRFGRLEHAPVPLVIVATDLLTGREAALSEGDARQAILASCAIPGVFPTVDHAGMTLVDGGLANNTALSQAVAAGADTVYVLSSGYACALPRPPRTAVGTAMQALTLLTHQRLVADVELYADRVDLVVLPAPCPLHVSPVDFGRAAELIDAAHRAAADHLAVTDGRRPHPGEDIGLHVHPRPVRARSATRHTLFTTSGSH
jgi:NTE family protein